MPKKILILNAGTQTRKAFASGLSLVSLERHRTKQMMLHIKKDLSLSFLQKNEEVDFTNAEVFTRLRANDAHFCGILYEHFESIGIRASDPINGSFEHSEEKIAQMPRLARAGVKIPETIIAREESFESNKEYILSHITFPLVYKTDGSQGRAVFKIESLEKLQEMIATKKRHELFLLQELIPNTFDTRTLVAYGTILGSIKRTAQKGVFQNNVAQGASVDMFTLSPEEQKIALDAVDACKMDFGGVDIIHTDQGPVVLEVNKSPQIGGFEKVHGKHYVFKTIAELIEKGH